MVNRTRERLFTFGPGWKERKITTNPPVRTDSLQDSISEGKYWQRCVDVTGLPNQDHPLTITERDNRGFLPLTGHIDQGAGSYITYDNWIPSGFTNVSHLSTSVPTVGASALTLRARTNPSREEVSVPNFIHELKDLPGMYRDIMSFKLRLRNLGSGRGDPRTIANYHLSTQMGFLPLISDLRKMMQFQHLADRRIVELNRLYSSRGLKRRLRLYSEVQSDQSDIVAESSLGTFIRVRKYKVTKIERWGTIRWIPTSVPKDLRRQDLGRIARKLVFGLHHRGVDAVQAWNALPWTWLIDWFANFDDFLEAHRNDIPAAPTGPCNIMTRTETYETWVRTDLFEQSIKGASGLRKLTTKERAQSSGSLSVTLPFLNGRQWSILGALALQRLPR